MPRTVRLEYENAFYHVMNRGRGRQTLFHGEYYYQSFCQTLQEAQQRFGILIHAYCLMGSHYHLLLQTPHANLSRVMRHINGVYTQRHNQLRRSDGSIFRGRFKSITVDADAYLLQLSRYIHRNPIDMRRPIVSQLEAYPWSSYPAYINASKSPEWLSRELTYQMLGNRQRYSGYRNYVVNGVDEEINRFYDKGNVATVLGSKAFKQKLLEQRKLIDKGIDLYSLLEKPEVSRIVDIVAAQYKISPKRLTKPQLHKNPNRVRKIAMYACQRYGMMTLKEIAEYFHLSNPGSVSNAIHHVRVELQSGVGVADIEAVDEALKMEQLT